MDIHFGGYQGGFTVQPDASCVNPKIDPQFKSNQDLFPVEICAMVLSEMKDIDLVSIHREKCTERSHHCSCIFQCGTTPCLSWESVKTSVSFLRKITTKIMQVLLFTKRQGAWNETQIIYPNQTHPIPPAQPYNPTIIIRHTRHGSPPIKLFQ
eukprot:78009_1